LTEELTCDWLGGADWDLWMLTGQNFIRRGLVRCTFGRLIKELTRDWLMVYGYADWDDSEENLHVIGRGC